MKHLIVCLDGTWNNRDDSTNVLHHHTLTIPGGAPEQVREYHRGVGTGVLDRVSGGAFGFGLEQNVRDAYNWLIEHYDDSDIDYPDELYIFGFSRGAYTARSLVGFIARCGLLRRGAPLTVRQLWSNYCILGRQAEKRTSFWNALFPVEVLPLRSLPDLIADPWQAKEFDATKKAAKVRAIDPDSLPGQKVAPLSDPERLFAFWSRRIRITYLGLYDTVGALGLDALAIPGLRSKLALHHNMHATTLVKSCRHALAIDEYRSNFKPTLFLEYQGHAREETDDNCNPCPRGMIEAHWRSRHGMWHSLIEQRWFVGAHANIGGGYPDNTLSELPRQWILDGARDHGLQCRPWAPTPRARYFPTDSFAEFLRPAWTMVLRAKRHYRTIDPAPIVRAHPNGEAFQGFTLQSVHETVDRSVAWYWETARKAPPPNLFRYACERLARLPKYVTPPPEIALFLRQWGHVWLEEGKFTERIALFAWAAAAGIGALAALRFFRLDDELIRPVVWAVGFALFFGAVDWSESAANFRLARSSAPEWFRVVRSALYWLRALGVVLFGFGILAVIRSWICGTWLPNHATPLASHLLFLQVCLAYVLVAYAWVTEPMRRTHLGSMVRLQARASKAGVDRQLDIWRCMLARGWLEDPVQDPAARATLVSTLRESLWRDVIGFIPVYLAVLAFGLWFASFDLDWSFLTATVVGLPVWAWWSLTAALANWAANAVHLSMAERSGTGVATAGAFVLTIIKLILFLAGYALLLAATIEGTWRLALKGANSGIQGAAALSLSVLALLSLATVAIGALLYSVKHAKPIPKQGAASADRAC